MTKNFAFCFFGGLKCPSLLTKRSLFNPGLALVSWLYLSKSSNIMSLVVQFPAVLLLAWSEAGGWREALCGSH